jgi:nucleoside-diphosphate-sugar epimerase
MREAVRRALAGEEAVLPSGGMEWVYSKDAAMGTVLALKAKALPSRIFNITMGKVATPEDLAAALRAAIPGAKVRIETPQAAAVSLPHMTHASNLEVARSVLDFTPQFALADAVGDFTAWLKAKRHPAAKAS